MKEEGMAGKYRLNVDPDREHELSDAEVRDLRAFGFQVSKAGAAARRPMTAPADKPAAEKKES